MLSLFPLFLNLLICWLVPFVFACTHMEHGYLEQWCNLLGTSKKGKDVSPPRAMFSWLGGLAPPKWFSLSLSKPLLWSICYGPWVWQCLFYISCTSLGHTLGTLAMSVLLSALHDSIVHDVCMYISMCIYIYINICLLVYGWLCTLYGRLSWLHEWSFLAIRALDLVV